MNGGRLEHNIDHSEQCQSCVDACDSCALDVSFGGDRVIKDSAHKDPEPPEAKNFSQQLECFCPYSLNDQCLLDSESPNPSIMSFKNLVYNENFDLV